MSMPSSRIPGVMIKEARRFHDDRGYFMEMWRRDPAGEGAALETFLQDNLSFSSHGVLRGLHFQHPQGQGKYLTVLDGEILDVIVDVRRGSPTFGEWESFALSSENGFQLYVPVGLAHGFVVTGERALLHYKCTETYAPDAEYTLQWNDPALGIEWPDLDLIISEKDQQGTLLADFDEQALPVYDADAPA